MATTTYGAPRAGASPAEDAGVALGDNRLVIAGHPGDDEPSAIVAAGLALTPLRRSTLMVLDLDRRAFVVAPGIAPDQGVISLTGDLDIASSSMFAGAIAVALHHRPSLVVLDVRRLTSIDARGTGTIVMAAARLRDWGGSLLVRGAPPSVLRVLEICGLEHLTGPVGARPLPVPPSRQRVAPAAAT